MVRIAHLTDPHVGPLPRARLRELLGKRITGWYNWHRGRGAAHDMELLAGLVADIRAQEPDHVVCTGDICNIGLASEWPTARVFLEGLGEPDRVSFVPGNHDAYIRGSLEGLLSEIAPWTRGDGEAEPRFPYLRRRGAVAVVGLSSAVPTLPFMATGRVGRAQIEAAGHLLAALAEHDVFRVVLVHHPPHVGGAAPGRNLLDARDMEAMLARAGAELVLHGHTHVGSVAWLAGPRRPIPVIGAPSASARGGTFTHAAGWHLYTIGRDETGFTLTAELRGFDTDGAVARLGMLPLHR